MTEQKKPTLLEKLDKFADGCLQLAKGLIYLVVAIFLFYVAAILLSATF